MDLGLGEKILDVLTGRKIESSTERIRFYLGWAGSLFAVATAAVLVWYGLPGTGTDRKPIALPFLVIWTVAPPMYFWFDYFVLWHVERKNGNSQFATLEEFKHGQELSRNLWLTIVALLAAIYFK